MSTKLYAYIDGLVQDCATPERLQWSYCSLALSHWFVLPWWWQNICYKTYIDTISLRIKTFAKKYSNIILKQCRWKHDYLKNLCRYNIYHDSYINSGQVIYAPSNSSWKSLQIVSQATESSRTINKFSLILFTTYVPLTKSYEKVTRKYVQ